MCHITLSRMCPPLKHSCVCHDMFEDVTWTYHYRHLPRVSCQCLKTKSHTCNCSVSIYSSKRESMYIFQHKQNCLQFYIPAQTYIYKIHLESQGFNVFSRESENVYIQTYTKLPAITHVFKHIPTYIQKYTCNRRVLMYYSERERMAFDCLLK